MYLSLTCFVAKEYLAFLKKPGGGEVYFHFYLVVSVLVEEPLIYRSACIRHTLLLSGRKQKGTGVGEEELWSLNSVRVRKMLRRTGKAILESVCSMKPCSLLTVMLGGRFLSSVATVLPRISNNPY